MLNSEEVKTRASELGFDLCGIAPVASFPELRLLREWLDRGFNGEMRYMDQSADRRSDAREVMPSSRSVVVLGTIYNTDRPYSTEINDPGEALISRYAWGDDYHDVLRSRTEALREWMVDRHSVPFESRVFVDTGPIQERVYAQQAGIGWVGKNTCLINPEIGSWLFLSEILCSLPLEPDQPGFDQCGSCTLCLDACPTDAFPKPGVLDSTRCLSYLTIEKKGVLPLEQRAGLGTHVYGCDICQEVCPYNGAAPTSADPAWQPRVSFDRPRLVELWVKTDSELRAAIRHGPMTRVRVRRLRRNLAVAIGNSGEAEAATVLYDNSEVGRPGTESLDEPLVAEHVDWARDRLGIS